MRPVLKVKGKKPKNAWQFEFHQEHFYVPEVPVPIEIQKQAHEITAKHVSEMLALLQLLGYKPETFKLSIEFEHVNP